MELAKISGLAAAYELLMQRGNKEKLVRIFLKLLIKKRLMNRRPNQHRLLNASPVMGIPIEFVADLPIHFPIKIRSHHPIADTTSMPGPFVSALFQIAHLPEEAMSNGKLILKTSVTELMLDAKNLDAVLKAKGKKRKTSIRRSLGRLEKRIFIQ